MPTGGLDYITIKGFKSIASVRVRLGQVNIVIGANGAGKSNFIGAFSFLRAVHKGELQEYVARAGGAEKILHFGSKTTERVSFHLSFKEEVNQYELSLIPTSDDSLYPSGEYAKYWDKQRFQDPYAKALSPTLQREAGISDPRVRRTAGWVREFLGSWRVYHVHDTSASSPMRKTAAIDDNQYLRTDGSNLAAFLYYLREKHKESYGLIRRSVQSVAPFFDDFLLAPQKLNPNSIKLEWKHKRSDQYFDASSLSDGTLRFIVLATLFLQPPDLRPSVILIDEPELGLHPYAIGVLAAMIKQASVETQVVVSTQSSLLLDYFEPEDVLVANRVNDGTEFTRLDRAQLAEWLEEYSLGQLWEKNEFGGRPGGD